MSTPTFLKGLSVKGKKLFFFHTSNRQQHSDSGGEGGEGCFQGPPAAEAGQTKAKEGQDQAQTVDGKRAVPL